MRKLVYVVAWVVLCFAVSFIHCLVDSGLKLQPLMQNFALLYASPFILPTMFISISLAKGVSIGIGLRVLLSLAFLLPKKFSAKTVLIFESVFSIITISLGLWLIWSAARF